MGLLVEAVLHVLTEGGYIFSHQTYPSMPKRRDEAFGFIPFGVQPGGSHRALRCFWIRVHRHLQIRELVRCLVDGIEVHDLFPNRCSQDLDGEGWWTSHGDCG